ncbi:MAG: diphosphomevalonate decarboxylase [Candidatus Micrarchaeota archaeon]|nr:diphosphomevalonate decarboxylase [Candidatus Micrarchaeota archaeon]
MSMKATAVANTNIALVKYWGKRNEELILPYNSSISVTLNNLFTITTVEFSKNLPHNEFVINNRLLNENEVEYSRIDNFSRIFKKLAGMDLNLKVVSKTNFPIASGLASSASAFAALAAAFNTALSLNLTYEELSKYARFGSGSASRSIYGGFVKWFKGEFDDGSDCFAKQIKDENYWPDFRILVCITSSKEKFVKSREAMHRTVKTSEFYDAWLQTVEKDLDEMEIAINNRDIRSLGLIAENNALKMHATMITSKPPIIYWNSATLKLIKSVLRLREEFKVNAYITIDAGHQVKIITTSDEIDRVKNYLSDIKEVEQFIVSSPGQGVKIVQEHLF